MKQFKPEKQRMVGKKRQRIVRVPVKFVGNRVGYAEIGRWKNGVLKMKIVMEDKTPIQFGYHNEMSIDLNIWSTKYKDIKTIDLDIEVEK